MAAGTGHPLGDACCLQGWGKVWLCWVPGDSGQRIVLYPLVLADGLLLDFLEAEPRAMSAWVLAMMTLESGLARPLVVGCQTQFFKHVAYPAY